MKRKLMGLIMCLMLVCTLVSPVAVNAADYSASRIVNYVNGRVGESYARGYCLRFVDESFQNIYGFREYSCCAYKCGSTYLDSASRDIPLGACVFFGGSDVTCSCGNRAGHIGIYVGNGNIVHAWAGKLVSTSIDYVVSCGYPYRGWGWLCNVTLTTGNPNPPSNITIKADMTTIGVGDTVTFAYTIDNASSKYIGIDYAGGSRYHSIPLSNSSGNVSYTFTQAGTYCVITEGSNSAGYNCCHGIYISVSNQSPSNITIKADKTTIGVGDTVNFIYTINNATSKHIGIDWAGGSRYYSIPLNNSSGSVSYTFNQAGTYCVITEGYNAVGYNCCHGIYITVTDSIKTSTTVTRTSGAIKVQTLLTNPPQSAQCVIAVYSSNGTLLRQTVNDVNSSTNSITAYFSNYSNASYVKVFLWDSLKGMKPLTNSEKVNI